MKNSQVHSSGLLKSGAKPAHGGARKGAGRKPEWLKDKCKDILDQNKLLDYLADIAAGRETEEVATKDGDVVRIQVSASVRIRAIDMLLDRGFGKAVQGVELTGEEGQPLTIQIVNYGDKA